MAAPYAAFTDAEGGYRGYSTGADGFMTFDQSGAVGGPASGMMSNSAPSYSVFNPAQFANQGNGAVPTGRVATGKGAYQPVASYEQDAINDHPLLEGVLA